MTKHSEILYKPYWMVSMELYLHMVRQELAKPIPCKVQSNCILEKYLIINT